MASPRLSMVVLAFRDAPALPELVADLERALGPAAPGSEVVIVDDGSGDDTLAVAETLAASRPGVRAVGHRANRGVGAAFRTGVEAATGEIVGYIDGDGQYLPDDLPKLLAIVSGGADVASGIRVRRADPWSRSVVSSVYRTVLRAVYGLRLRDVNSGLKLYRRGALESAWPLLSDGPFYDAEVLIKLDRAGAKIVETPIRHRTRRYGRAGGASLASIRGAVAGVVGLLQLLLGPQRAR